MDKTRNKLNKKTKKQERAKRENKRKNGKTRGKPNNKIGVESKQIIDGKKRDWQKQIDENSGKTAKTRKTEITKTRTNQRNKT
jgi:hypothetical protein